MKDIYTTSESIACRIRRSNSEIFREFFKICRQGNAPSFFRIVSEFVADRYPKRLLVKSELYIVPASLKNQALAGCNENSALKPLQPASSASFQKFQMKFQIQKSKKIDRVVPDDEIGLCSTFQRLNWPRMNDNHPDEIDITSISQLVSAAKDGDSAAHSEICRQVQGQLNRMADQHLDTKLRRKLNPSDIVQATLTRMVEGFGDFRGSSSTEFYGWLNTILKNEVNSTRRDFQRQRRDVRRETEPTSAVVLGQQANDEMPDERLQTQEKMIRFREVIDRLPQDQARAIQLRSIQELPFEEVARQMDRSVNAVSKLWSRALISLQKELAKLDDSFAS